jgi:pSer/pThr/pTyr-binding forkhead associated (FHA) protein
MAADSRSPIESTVPPAAQRASVRIESGFYEGLEWELDRPSTVIGRGRNADLVLNEATISRAHALFGYEGLRVFVQDLGSTNGTLVNGVREHRKVLTAGDELRMGKLQLRIRAEAAAKGGAARG